jgi:hypothetical protein
MNNNMPQNDMPQNNIPENNLNKILRTILIILAIALVITIFKPMPARAEYGRTTSDMPFINGILFRTGASVANISLNDVVYVVSAQETLEDEWQIEEIRRKSILFHKKSNRAFVEIYLNHPKNLRQTVDTSFIGSNLSLFDALAMVAKSYGIHVVMQGTCYATVSPDIQPSSLQALFKQLVKPPYQTIENHPFYHVVTDKNKYNNLENKSFFHSTYNLESLEALYPGLQNHGTLLANGEDIRQTLSRLAIATNIPILLAENLYFPVFAVFHNVKFSVILEKLLYTNDCNLVEYEKGIEVVR